MFHERIHIRIESNQVGHKNLNGDANTWSRVFPGQHSMSVTFHPRRQGSFLQKIAGVDIRRRDNMRYLPLESSRTLYSASDAMTPTHLPTCLHFAPLCDGLGDKLIT